MDKKAAEKKERLLAVLEQGMVMVHLDARRPGVMVPAALRSEAHLRLNLSYRFDPPDLSVSEWGVRSTLSFSGNRFTVGVPWSALFAITSHGTKEFWMYPDDMPPELVQSESEGETTEPEPVAPAPVAAAPRAQGHLREIALERRAEAAPTPETKPLSDEPVAVEPAPAQVSSEGSSEEPPPPRKGGHLRLVK